MELAADIFSETGLLGLEATDTAGLWELLIRFVFNSVVVGIMIHFFYYPKSKRKDYYFTFSLIAVSVFFLIFLLGSVKLKIGFALGIFAIFGIIRYRTESIAIREMTYLFTIIAISVINALSVQIGYTEIVAANLIFILVTFVLESSRCIKHISCKLILYDKIDLIVPDKRNELIRDLSDRTGLNIKKIEVGHIDFLRDSAMLKVYYDSPEDEINTVDQLTKLPRENEGL